MRIGVDEAGRGPVIGPLVVCAFAATSISELSELGVRDSKDLSKKRREEIYATLVKMPHSIVICPPERIDCHHNLNDLEVELFAEALSVMPPGETMLDACDVNAERFARNVSQKSGRECMAEHGADTNHLEVGAASIIAKVTRDRAIDELSKEIGIEIGSGYPSDPKTKAAVKILVQGDTPHECMRWSWKTTSDAWGGRPPPRPSESQRTLF